MRRQGPSREAPAIDVPELHRWDLDPMAAVALQRALAGRVELGPSLPPPELIAAADVSFDRGRPTLYAAVVVVRAGSFEVVERMGFAGPGAFPYIPGLLSFREIPALLEAFRKLRTRPDVVLCDGQGIAHPRRLGIASHLGLWLGLPTVGCAKSRLCGRYQEPGPERGSRAALIDRGEEIGSVVRTRRGVQPLYVSPGHCCDLESAVDLVLDTAPRLRLPVPARMAHAYVNEIRRAVAAGGPIPD